MIGIFARRREPYRRFNDFLPAPTADQILAQLLNRQDEFCGLAGNRNFLRLPNPLEMLPGFSERLTTILPEVQSIFAIDLNEPEVELYVHAYNDGTHFDRHQDTHGGGNWRRRLSCVYYVHRRPRAFEGGSLVVYDRRGYAHAVAPDHNTAVFFPAALVHEVTRITCRTRAFADSRFSINVWIM
jgi:Rps23 Pro-64 3,4-dihydroxylase Tpa1-like proline 4-hydroxylase